MRFSAFCCLLGLLVGCTTQRTVTIQTRPEATIKIDGVERGRGSVTENFVFNGAAEVHKIQATRMGFKDAVHTLTRDYDKDTLLLNLAPQSKRISVSVLPLPALISIDGQLAGVEPTDRFSRELEFSVDNKGAWTTHTISAERRGFQKAEVVVGFNDRDSNYVLNLPPMAKDLHITSTPPGATVAIDGQTVGKTPLEIPARPFPVNTDTNEFIPQKLVLVKPGYDPVERTISWDDALSDYAIPLTPKTKTVRILTNPSNPTVQIAGGPEVKNDSSGAAVATLTFPPVDEQGNLRTYDLTVSKKTADSEWYPQKLTIGWDGGKTDYSLGLKEILTRPVSLVQMLPQRTDEGWRMLPRETITTAMKDVSESGGKEPPVRLLRVGAGEYIDSLTLSPDGSQLLYSVLIKVDPADSRSQLRSMPVEATGSVTQLTDGKSLELMPVYTPDGAQILFSSNRAGKTLNIFSMSATGQSGITQLTQGNTNDLWPSMDADPKPRLFFQRMVDMRPDPRLYRKQIDAEPTTDLTPAGGAQPRINPKGDLLLFTLVNDNTGKRDIYRMSDKGGSTPENLTNTPDADECDPVWNRDGSKIAFASDRGVNEEKQHHYDIWIIDLKNPGQSTQLTSNGSWDDCPVWDPSGNAIYFRSNRGGEWGIWRVSVK